MLKRGIGVLSIGPGRPGGRIAPVIIDYDISLAQRAVPDGQATVDALHSLPEIGGGAPIGYAGVTLGCRDWAEVDGDRNPDRDD